MVVKKKNFTDSESLAKLLPEGLTEDVVTKIAELVNLKVNETIKDKMDALNDKVRAFVRGNIEKLKEQALKELELENETFRNAQMFESVKAMFAIENNKTDEDNAINTLTEATEGQDEKITVLVSEVDRLVKENLSLKRNIKILSDKNKGLNESVVSLKEIGKSNSGKIMSDRAIVVNSDTFKSRANDNKKGATEMVNENEFLTPDVLAASRKLGIGIKK